MNDEDPTVACIAISVALFAWICQMVVPSFVSFVVFLSALVAIVALSRWHSEER